MLNLEFRERLQQTLMKEAKRLGGFKPLEAALRKTLLGTDLPTLTRRQLAKLCAVRGDLALTTKQFEALDYFLQLRCRTSMAQLWSNRSLLQSLAADELIMFILGSQPEPAARRIDLSRWDIRAMREVLNGLYVQGMPLNVKFEDVISRADTKSLESNVPRNETWFYELTEDDAPAVVCIGSPKANHGAEVILARMTGVEPFRPWPEDKPRPFAFIWPGNDSRSRKIKSCMKLDPHRDAEEIMKLKGATAEILAELQKGKKGNTLGIAVGDELLTVDRNDEEWHSYAIIAARRGAKRTEVCIAGLTGPATLGAARVLCDFKPQLLSQDADSPSEMAWQLVKTRVTDDKQPTFRSDERRAHESTLVGELKYFPERRDPSRDGDEPLPSGSKSKSF